MPTYVGVFKVIASFFFVNCDKIAVEDFAVTNVGFELYFNNFFSSVIIFTSTVFQKLFVVLPKTLLLKSFKKSFSNEFLRLFVSVY